MNLITSNDKFKEDLERNFIREQPRFKLGYGDKLPLKQKKEFEKYIEVYMANSSRHLNMVKDNAMRKMYIMCFSSYIQ